MPHVSEKEFQAQDDLRTLKNAEEIKKSKPRMGAAKKMAKQEMKAIAKVIKAKTKR